MKRRVSWFLGLAVYLAPPVWAFFAIQADSAAKTANRGWACGAPLIGLVFLACLASAVLSLCATIVSLRALPQPRSIIRRVEIAVLAVPFLVASSYAAFLIFG